MKKQILDLLEADHRTLMPSWKGRVEFKSYIEASNTIPSLIDVDKGGKEFFDKMETTFFNEFLSRYKEHIKSVWRSDKFYRT